MKQTLQQLGGTLGKAFVNLLKPAVQGLTRFFNTLISLVEKAVNAIGKLLGWQIRIDPVGAQFEEDAEGAAGALDDAAGGAGGTAKGLDDAADAAKKLNKQLMAYDEINNIKLPDEDEDTSGSGSPGGGGGGGGASGGGAGEGGAATGGGVTWEKYQSDIGSWFQLGKKIGDYLTDAMENIDWESIYKKADNFGRGLANFLNGLISPGLFGALGQTIAGALNTELHFLDSFGSRFSWQNFGESLATGVNRFFSTFDFGLLAHSLNTWANGLLKALISFLRTVDWEQVGTGIGEFLAGIDFGEIARNIAVALYEALNGAFKAYASTLNLAPIETALLTIGGLAIFSRSSPIRLIGKWFNSAYDGAKNFFDLVGTAAFDADGRFVGFGRTLQNLGDKLTPVQKAVTGIATGIAEFFLVKDGVSDIILALDQNKGDWTAIWSDYKAQVAQIGGAILGASAVFTMVLGVPGGVIAGLLVGAAAAWAGYVEAINKIDLERFSRTVHDALTMSGGMPLEDLINQTANDILSIGDSFDEVSDKVQAFEATEDTVRDVVFEIDKIHISLRNGLTTAEEAVPRLVELYDQLATAIETKIGAAGDVLLAVFNPDGAIGQAFEQSGTAAEAMQDRVVNSMDSLQQRILEVKTRISELNSELQGGVSEERAGEIQQELGSLETELRDLSSSLSETETAMTNLDVVLKTHSLDWSTFLSADGTEVDTAKLTSALDGISDAITNVKTTAENDITAAVEAAKALKDPQLVADIQNGIPGAMDELNRQLAEKASETTNLMQTQVIEGINQVIADAQVDWGKLGTTEQNNTYHGDVDEFIKKRVDEYKTNIVDPTAQAIVNSLGTDYEWVSGAASSIIDKMFEVKDTYDKGDPFAIMNAAELGLPETATNIVTTFGEALEAAMEEYPGLDSEKLSEMLKVKEAGESLGKDTTDGFAEGAEKNANTVGAAMETVSETGYNAAKKYNQIGSPSKLYERMAGFIVDGAVDGINNNKDKFANVLKQMASEAATGFRTALQEGVNTAVKNLSVPKVSASVGVPGVMQGQMSAASSAVDNSMQEMFTDVLPQYFEAGQWDGLFATLSSTLDIGLEGIAGSFDEWMTGFWNEHLTVWFEDSKLKEGIFTPLETNLDDEWTSLTTWFDTSMNKWWDEDLTPWFAADKWEPQFDTINTAADTGFQKVRRTIGDLLDKITDDVKKSCKKMGDDLKDISDSLRDTKDLSNISVTVDAKGARSYATGGFVEDGYFFANHNELVGRFSNGRTAVANNAQIVAGIQAGVYAAVRDAMNDSGGTQVVIQGDTDRIFRVMQNKSRQFQRSTGSPAFG